MNELKPAHQGRKTLADKVVPMTTSTSLGNRARCHGKYKVATLTSGHMFGEYDASKVQNVGSTVVCVSTQGQAYRMHKDELQALKNNSEVWESIKLKNT